MKAWLEELKARLQVLRWVLSLGVMFVSVWLLVRELDWVQVLGALQTANYTWVAVGVLAIVGTFFARVWRWQALLWRTNLRFWPALTALLVGQVANMILPMRGGDLVRAMWVRPERGAEPDRDAHDVPPAAGASEALGSVALEKVWEMFWRSAGKRLSIQ